MLCTSYEFFIRSYDSLSYRSFSIIHCSLEETGMCVDMWCLLAGRSIFGCSREWGRRCSLRYGAGRNCAMCISWLLETWSNSSMSCASIPPLGTRASLFPASREMFPVILIIFQRWNVSRVREYVGCGDHPLSTLCRLACKAEVGTAVLLSDVGLAGTTDDACVDGCRRWATDKS